MTQRRWKKGGGVGVGVVSLDVDLAVEELERIELDCVDVTSPVDVQLRTLNERSMKPFQIEGAEWLCERERAALCDEQGTGKCIQVLRANMGSAMIVVCPASIRLYWRDEAAKWAPSTRVKLATSEELPPPRHDELVIASWDSLPDPAKLSRSAFAHVRIVFDEAQWGKGDTERALRARALAACTRKVWLSTGSPLAGTPDDLWNVLELARLGVEAFGSRERFIEAFGGARSGVRGALEWPHEPPEADPFIRDALRAVMLRRLRKDVLPELPEKTYEVIRVEVPPALVEALSATDAAWRAIGRDRLPPFELLSEVQHKLACSRIEAVREYCSTRAEPLVLFSDHTEPVRAFENVPGWGTITGSSATMCERDGRVRRLTTERSRMRVVRRFMSGELQNIALTIGVGGTGLTLTRSSHIVRVSRRYTPADNEQAEDRVARIGQTSQTITITDFISDHPVEDRLLEICAIKSARINATINAAARR